jgi:hypothetical protein
MWYMAWLRLPCVVHALYGYSMVVHCVVCGLAVCLQCALAVARGRRGDGSVRGKWVRLVDWVRVAGAAVDQAQRGDGDGDEGDSGTGAAESDDGHVAGKEVLAGGGGGSNAATRDGSGCSVLSSPGCGWSCF